MQGRFEMEYRLFTIVRYNYKDYNSDSITTSPVPPTPSCPLMRVKCMYTDNIPSRNAISSTLDPHNSFLAEYHNN